MADNRAYGIGDLDETDFSIAEYLPDSVLPHCSVNEPVHSFDFDVNGGLQAPRDGVQRPLLFSDTPSLPPSRDRRRRGPHPVIHVTHVHQTVLQTATPTAVATPLAAAAVDRTLEGLEGALSLRPGSLSHPPSRWHHRPKRDMVTNASKCGNA